MNGYGKIYFVANQVDWQEGLFFEN